MNNRSGVAGTNIQRIMRTHSAFVKLATTEELATLGGFASNVDNVIVRTPAKNAPALICLRSALNELVNVKDRNFVLREVEVQRRWHRLLQGIRGPLLRDIEGQTGVRIIFPPREDGSDSVRLFGAECEVQRAVLMLLEHIPYIAYVSLLPVLAVLTPNSEYRVPSSSALDRASFDTVVLAADFAELGERIKCNLDISIGVVQSAGETESIVRFSTSRSNVDFLSTARDMIEEHLAERGVRHTPIGKALICTGPATPRLATTSVRRHLLLLPQQAPLYHVRRWVSPRASARRLLVQTPPYGSRPLEWFAERLRPPISTSRPYSTACHPLSTRTVVLAPARPSPNSATPTPHSNVPHYRPPFRRTRIPLPRLQTTTGRRLVPLSPP